MDFKFILVRELLRTTRRLRSISGCQQTKAMTMANASTVSALRKAAVLPKTSRKRPSIIDWPPIKEMQTRKKD
jgi:hypothetical protein